MSIKSDELERFNVERASHVTIGDRHFVILDRYLGQYPLGPRPQGVKPVVMQYELRHVMVPLDRTQYRMMQLRDGDIVWIKYKVESGKTGYEDYKTHVITEAQ
jgi:hypothetical protein